MDTTTLKNFATWARRELTREVNARLTSALAPGSTDRIERASAVTVLEADIANSGDRDSIVDKVAYTWFNRIIALRFMDANNYTGIGVVSPAYGQPLGQPEVLAEAKRGSVDPDVVHPQTRTKVLQLLDGTRRSNDPQGEAYRTLLAAYCGHWSEFMPFMFEREDAYTNLLMPGHLLADESMLNHAVKVLSSEVCEDVEVIGWLYQFYISERKDEVFAGFKKNKKAGAAEIPAATQLFTPEWIVRYLVENSLGRLWLLNNPDSQLVEKMDYYIAPVEEETDFLRLDGPEELTIIDPACGSGHMLTYAFDLLYAIYEEEGYAPSEIPSLILTHNIYGTEIDERAGALAAFALMMKARAKQRRFFGKQVKPNVCVISPIVFTSSELSILTSGRELSGNHADFWNQFAQADTLGSLTKPIKGKTEKASEAVKNLKLIENISSYRLVDKVEKFLKQSHYLSSQFSIVITNPPYMGRNQMGQSLRVWAEKNSPEGKNDLYTLFMQASEGLLLDKGYMAMIAPHSWMFLSRYEKFRIQILGTYNISNLAHLGTRAFDTIGGEVVQVAAFSMVKNGGSPYGNYVRLTDIDNSEGKRRAFLEAKNGDPKNQVFFRDSQKFPLIPSSPVAYWAPESIIQAFTLYPPLGDLAPARKGMVTARNDVFLRLWTEVSAGKCGFDNFSSREAAKQSGQKWFSYIKGGKATKWWGNFEYITRGWEACRPCSIEKLPPFAKASGKFTSRDIAPVYIWLKNII